MGRPSPPQSPDIRPARGEINGIALDELSASPASPAYRSKLPPPPCFKCGEDHIPGRTYGHNWEPEPLPEPQQSYVHAIPQGSFTPPPATPPAAQRRVAVYVGRGDTFVVAVEEAPEWDAVETFKVAEDRVLDLVKLARALDIKVQDKTGGELACLQT